MTNGRGPPNNKVGTYLILDSSGKTIETCRLKATANEMIRELKKNIFR